MVLTNVMLYWLFATPASAARYYQESPAREVHAAARVPVAVAVPTDDIHLPVRRHAEERLDVVRWTELPGCGHFAALEQPEAVAADLRATADRVKAL